MRLVLALLLCLASGAAGAQSLSGFPSPGQLPGTATNNSASAGNVGELISSVVPVGSAAPLTTATAATVTSITLTPGDWDVWAGCGFTGDATTTVTYDLCSLSTTAGLTQGAGAMAVVWGGGGTLYNSITSFQIASPRKRFSVSANTTINLVEQSVFATSTSAGWGGLFASRAR